MAYFDEHATLNLWAIAVLHSETCILYTCNCSKCYNNTFETLQALLGQTLRQCLFIGMLQMEPGYKLPHPILQAQVHLSGFPPDRLPLKHQQMRPVKVCIH